MCEKLRVFIRVCVKCYGSNLAKFNGRDSPKYKLKWPNAYTIKRTYVRARLDAGRIVVVKRGSV